MSNSHLASIIQYGSILTVQELDIHVLLYMYMYMYICIIIIKQYKLLD